MTSPFTAAQTQAITAAQSVAIAAGAGSGKTRVLAERVVHLLDHRHGPRSDRRRDVYRGGRRRAARAHRHVRRGPGRG